MPTVTTALATERAIIASGNGSPQFLGIIIAGTTAKNNATTATPFPLAGQPPVPTQTQLKGMYLLLQSDVNCYVQQFTDSTSVAVASDSAGGAFFLPARQFLSFIMGPTEGWLSVVASGAVQLKVWRLQAV